MRSRAAMNVDFPTGTYTYSATNGTTTDTTSYTRPADAFSSTLPYLTGTDYTDLQGMNPSAPFAVHFSVNTPAASASQAFSFFTIRDTSSSQLVYNAAFLPSTTTGVTVPANTLTTGTQYEYELIFSDRVLTDSPGAEFQAQLGFDERTTGFFTPGAAPEPSCMGLIAGGAMLLARRRR